jgi:hypothetical protein
MIDSNLFDQAQIIAHSLMEKSTAEALKWCIDNKNGLRKIKVNLYLVKTLKRIINGSSNQ